MIPINHYLRPQRTAAQTVAGLQTELRIRSRFSRLDPGQFLNPVEEVLGAPKVTGGAHTYMDFMASRTVQAEGLIKGNYLQNLAQRHVQFLTDHLQHFSRKPVIFVLDIHEYLYYRTLLAIILTNNPVDLIFIHSPCTDLHHFP